MGSLPLILAQAGSGSGGFGGGGGGGGGGGFGGGSSGSGEGDPIVAVVVFGLFGIFLLYLAIHTVRYRRKLRERDREVRTASAEAAEDDAYFASDELVRHAVALFRAAQMAWDARDREGLARLVGPDLLVEWQRRLDDFDQKGWHNRVEVVGDPHRAVRGHHESGGRRRGPRGRPDRGQAEGVRPGPRRHQRVMRDGEKDELVTLVEYWTLARSNGAWMVQSIEQRSEGDHHLDGQIVASPWSDEQRLDDESLTELAVADGLPESFTTADLAQLDFDGDARAHALDLSLADARFAPDVLEAAARRAVEAWSEAVDGDDAALERIASPEAVAGLLYAGDVTRATRLVVRGAAREADPDRRCPGGAGAGHDDGRSRARRPALRGGPRHGGRGERIEGQRGDVHGALDPRPRRAIRRALADSRNRLSAAGGSVRETHQARVS